MNAVGSPNLVNFYTIIDVLPMNNIDIKQNSQWNNQSIFHYPIRRTRIKKVYYNKNATTPISEPFALLLNIGKGLQGVEKEKEVNFDLFPTLAPQGGLFSNQFWDELRSYATLNYLIIKVMNNREVGLILVVLAILSWLSQ